MIHSFHHHYHLHRLHQMTEMKRVFWAHLLSVSANAMVLIFVPIYLLQLGYSLTDVLLYTALQGLYSLLLQVPAGALIARFGAHRLMVAGLLSQVLFMAGLVSLPDHHWPLAILALLWALFRVSYFPAFHVVFSKARAHAKSGQQIGAAQAIRILATGFAPAVGGVLASVAGINWVYAFAIVLYVVAAVPLLRAPEITTRRPLRMRLLNIRKITPDLTASFGNITTTLAEGVIWPILVFLIIPTYVGVGLLSSVAIFASVFTAIYVGWREAERGPRHYLRRGVFVSSANDGLRLLAQNAGHVFGINLVGGLGNSLYYTPYFSRLYQHADEEPRVEYVVAFELAAEFGWSVLAVTICLLSLVLPEKTVLLVAIALAIPANFLIQRVR